MKTLRSFFVLVMSFIVLGSIAWAVEEAAAPAVPAVAPEASKPMAMDPAMMEKIKALAAPGEQHAVFEPLIGRWNYSGKFWMAPDAEPQETKGKSLNTIVEGKRFLKQEVEGPWMGETFHGTGYIGYDNIKQEYVSVWIDNMSTGMMSSSGQYDSATQTLSLSGTASCPMTGEKDRPMRSAWTITDKDHSTYVSYMKGPDSQEFKAMELNYTRVK